MMTSPLNVTLHRKWSQTSFLPVPKFHSEVASVRSVVLGYVQGTPDSAKIPKDQLA